jgi:hypothetical protein
MSQYFMSPIIGSGRRPDGPGDPGDAYRSALQDLCEGRGVVCRSRWPINPVTGHPDSQWALCWVSDASLLPPLPPEIVALGDGQSVDEIGAAQRGRVRAAALARGVKSVDTEGRGLNARDLVRALGRHLTLPDQVIEGMGKWRSR